jgi:XTP/dITP diphosphohydrolase
MIRWNMELVFATNNQHKLTEVRNLLNDRFIVRSLEEIGCREEIPEDQPTLEGNALQKAQFVYSHYGLNCFADDTGLEVEALGGEPGVLSARFAGSGKNSDDNIRKLLDRLSEIKNRNARFRTVISLVVDGKETLFEGIAEGTILYEKRGRNGFGYDPVFCPKGRTCSFAEMDLESKNKISHRALAFEKLVHFLNNER